jgi:hypothetical protein
MYFDIFEPFYTLFKNIKNVEKNEKFFIIFIKSIPNSSYTYCMKEKLMFTDIELDEEA